MSHRFDRDKLDHEQLRNLEGVIIANRVSNSKGVLSDKESPVLQTLVTFDNGTRGCFSN